MSYQLIYTSAAHLLDSGASGYGVVARSGALPRTLSRKLVELSEYKETAGQGIAGPQYSYRVLDCSGTLFHILSCVQSAGADYSRRSCHIAHHLALTYDEVQTLRRNAARPTPAGIILALRKAGFWCSRWEGEPQVIETEPRLTASALPDATTQATWKVMTGHKSNARAFFTPPYDKESLVIVPPGTRAEDILLLFNESDWLSATRGWGKTFTTYGEQNDSYAETQRICTTPGSSLEQRASFSRKPVISISLSMTLPDQQEFAPESDPLGSGVAKTLLQNTPPAQAEGQNHIPYKYIESPDEESFDTPPPHSPMLQWGISLAALAALAGGVYALTSAKVDDAGKAAGKIIIHQLHPGENRTLLEELLQEPYSAEKVSRQLDKLESRLASAVTTGVMEPREQLLLDCVSLLRHASLDNRGHAANLHRLAECAEALQMEAPALCQLYMHEATHDRPVEDWILSITPAERTEWNLFIRDFPEMAGWLLQPPFFPFMQSLLLPPPGQPPASSPAPDNGADSMEDAGSTGEEEGDPGTAAEEPCPTPLSPLPLLPGDDLPGPVLDFLLAAPADVAPGNYAVSVFGMPQNPATFSHPHGTGGTLHIEPATAQPSALFHLELRDAGEAPFPRVDISLGPDGKLAHVSCDGRPAAVCLTLSHGGHAYSYLLAGQLEVPVIPMGESMPPDAGQVSLTLTPEDLELHSPTPNFPRPLLILKERRNFPWAPLRNELQLRRPLLVQLPALAGAGKIGHSQPADPSLPYEWNALPASGGGAASDTWEFHVWRVNDFSHALSQAFFQTANESCCGRNPQGDPALTLASLYALTVEMDKPGLPKKARSELFAAYCRLFADKQFSGILNQLLEEAPQLCLSPEQAVGSGGANHRARHYVEKELSQPSSRALIRRKVAEALSQTVAKAYTEERARQAGETQEAMSLRLQGISTTAQGELMWLFSLAPPSIMNPSPRNK